MRRIGLENFKFPRNMNLWPQNLKFMVYKIKLFAAMINFNRKSSRFIGNNHFISFHLLNYVSGNENKIKNCEEKTLNDLINFKT